MKPEILKLIARIFIEKTLRATVHRPDKLDSPPWISMSISALLSRAPFWDAFLRMLPEALAASAYLAHSCGSGEPRDCLVARGRPQWEGTGAVRYRGGTQP
jgi:hypothetical protein